MLKIGKRSSKSEHEQSCECQERERTLAASFLFGNNRQHMFQCCMRGALKLCQTAIRLKKIVGHEYLCVVLCILYYFFTKNQYPHTGKIFPYPYPLLLTLTLDNRLLKLFFHTGNLIFFRWCRSRLIPAVALRWPPTVAPDAVPVHPCTLAELWPASHPGAKAGTNEETAAQ